MPDAPLTCIDIWLKAGSSYEQGGEEGIAHFLEHMIFKGSSKINEGEFDKRIEALGGSSNAATGLDDVHYYVLLPPKAVSKGIELLTNLVLSPSLEEIPFELEREVVLEEISQHQDQPEEIIFQSLLKNCWPNHSYGRSILGIKEVLIASNRFDMRAFHNRLYQPENIALGIAGFIPNDIEKILEQNEISKIKSVELTSSNKSEERVLHFKSGRKEIEVPRLESARITMAWPLAKASNQEELMGADLATSILAEGRRSKLVHHLRETLQIVESIDMDITSLEQGGLFLLEASCLVQNVQKVENEIKNILVDSFERETTDFQITRAKELVKNSICFGLELPSQIAAISTSQILWDRHQCLLEPIKYIDFWNKSNLRTEIFSKIQPNDSFTLIALPKL